MPLSDFFLFNKYLKINNIIFKTMPYRVLEAHKQLFNSPKAEQNILNEDFVFQYLFKDKIDFIATDERKIIIIEMKMKYGNICPLENKLEMHLLWDNNYD